MSRGPARAAAASAAVSGMQPALRAIPRPIAVMAASRTGPAAIATEEPLLTVILARQDAAMAGRLHLAALLAVLQVIAAVRGPP